jgi:hypothetical protein
MISLSTLLAVAAVTQSSGALSSIPAKYMPPTPPPSKVVVVVNGIKVVEKDVAPLLWATYSPTITDEIISYLVVKAEAKKQSVHVSPKAIEAEVEKQIERTEAGIAAQPSKYPGMTADQLLLENGISKPLLYMTAEAHLLTRSLILQKFNAAEFVKVATVIVRPKSDLASDVGDAAKKADTAYTELMQGGQWDQVLKTFADERGVEMHGVLGWRLANVFPASVQEEMKHLKVGGYTKPAYTPYGFQIFRLDMRGTEAKGADLDRLREEYAKEDEARFIAQLRKEAKIVRPK